MAHGYPFSYQVVRRGHVPWALMASIYEAAAAWLEENPQYDPLTAIDAVSRKLTRSERAALVAWRAFRDSFGILLGDDAGLLMLCFAATWARSGDWRFGEAA